MKVLYYPYICSNERLASNFNSKCQNQTIFHDIHKQTHTPRTYTDIHTMAHCHIEIASQSPFHLCNWIGSRIMSCHWKLNFYDFSSNIKLWIWTIIKYFNIILHMKKASGMNSIIILQMCFLIFVDSRSNI